MYTINKSRDILQNILHYRETEYKTLRNTSQGLNYIMEGNINLGANVRHIRLSSKLTQRTLGEKIGVSGKTVGMWERGDVGSIKKGTLLALSRFFSHILGCEITPDDLKTRDLLAEDFNSSANNIFPAGIPTYIPVISQNEAGISHDYTTNDYSKEKGYEFVERPVDVVEKNAYAVRITDINMVPALEPLDIIIVSPDKPFVNNKIYLVRTISGEVLIKSVFRKGDYYILQSNNSNKEPILINVNKIMALHKLIWLKKG